MNQRSFPIGARPGRRKLPVGTTRAKCPIRSPKTVRSLAAIREREQLHLVSFERAAVGIAHVGLDGRFFHANDALCQMLQYSREELRELNYNELTVPRHREASVAGANQLLSGDLDVFSLEKQYIRKDGKPIWVSLTSRLVASSPHHPKHFLTIIVDIDDRKSVEREMERQIGLLDHAYDAIISWELDGAITFWNQGAARLYGYSKEEAIGRASHELLQTRHPAPLSEFLAQLREDEIWEGEISHMHKDGSRIDVESRTVLVQSGEHKTVIEANRDITQRAKIERELQESEEQFRTLAESLPQIVFTTDAAGGFTYVNAGWLKFSGLSIEESLGASWLEAVDLADRETVSRKWLGSTIWGEPFEAEFRLIGADGTPRWFLGRAVAQRDRGGSILKWVHAITDVTDRHRSIETLRQSEARFRRLFDANLFGVVFWSEQGEMIDANDAFLSMLGFDRIALRAGTLQELKLVRDEGERSSGDGNAVLAPYETWFPHRDGRHVPVMVAAADSPGAAGERFSVVVDLSEREARERFEQEFLADVAHDLRNPLAATKAQAQVMRRRLKANRLERDALDDGLSTIVANSTRMARRIEELTDVAQLRAGHALELMREPVDLVALAENTAEIYRQATERQEIRVESRHASLVGNWDMSRIERVLDNLLSNAVKYSPQGGPITVTVDQDNSGGQECARLSVSDRGVGIPISDRAAIFERFRRGSNVKGHVGGSGIGLAGARTIIEQHDGTIAVETELGAGSTFIVHLPLFQPEPGDGSSMQGGGS